jgi:hypothetical protein
MAPKKEQVFGGIGGIICISAIILAIVFGILWGEQRDKRKKCDDKKSVYYKSSEDNATNVQCVNSCNAPVYSMGGINCGDNGKNNNITIKTASECSNDCNKANKNNPIKAP